jgi:beta-N-acetylhexosaminidase
MELIESTFSGASDRTENDEQAQKRAAVKSLHDVENQAEAIEPGAEKETEQANKDARSVSMSKAEPPGEPEQANKRTGSQSSENGNPSNEDEDDDPTPRRLPAVKIGQAPGMSLRPPTQPSKNVIPSRRTIFDNDRMSSAIKREILSIDILTGANQEKSSAAVAISEKVPSAEIDLFSGQQELFPAAVSLPTRTDPPVADAPTTPLPTLAPVKPLEHQRSLLKRKKALLLAALLAILLVNALAASFNQSFGAQGWASVWDNQNTPNQNLLTQIAQQLQHSPTPGGKATATPAVNPMQVVNLLMSNMTLDEKLGQMMMVQFTGPDYSPQLEAMISQYKVGSVLVFSANGNIVSTPQLKGLLAQMQKNAFLPLAISIDQEGGTVDRLIKLDGAQPAAATIGASGDPQQAYEQGIKDAQDLASYGFNLNLAPVVDVTNVYNDQLYDRTYGDNPALVTTMAGAYLQGLQKSGKILGTLKHFPGLGDVSVDPHYRPPDLTRSLTDLNTIDWAPYTNLIKQGNVYAVMVTHEYVSALDTTRPSSLSPKVIGILRQQMHFQGVIMTDSLTMDSISNYYSPGQAAALAVEAGDDLLMGAQSPNELATMLQGIKQAIASGAISQQHIDDSVRRILLMKYQMGLIHV